MSLPPEALRLSRNRKSESESESESESVSVNVSETRTEKEKETEKENGKGAERRLTETEEGTEVLSCAVGGGERMHGREGGGGRGILCHHSNLFYDGEPETEMMAAANESANVTGTGTETEKGKETETERESGTEEETEGEIEIEVESGRRGRLMTSITAAESSTFQAEMDTVVSAQRALLGRIVQ